MTLTITTDQPAATHGRDRATAPPSSDAAARTSTRWPQPGAGFTARDAAAPAAATGRRCTGIELRVQEVRAGGRARRDARSCGRSTAPRPDRCCAAASATPSRSP